MVEEFNNEYPRSERRAVILGSDEDIEAEKKRLGYIEGMEKPVWMGPVPDPETPEYEEYMEYVGRRTDHSRNQTIGLLVDAGASHIVADSFED